MMAGILCSQIVQGNSYIAYTFILDINTLQAICATTTSINGPFQFVSMLIYHQLLTTSCQSVYRIAGIFGRVFNLAVWRSRKKMAN